MLCDRFGEIMQVYEDIFDAGPSQIFQVIFKDGLAVRRDHDLRHGIGQRSEAHALARSEYYGFHGLDPAEPHFFPDIRNRPLQTRPQVDFRLPPELFGLADIRQSLLGF